MRQPQLGQKILKLRQEKGLTQEELVERCHVSVRTIQRIEAGEVTPRNYTIKSILNALDYNFKQLNKENPIIKQELKTLFLFDIDNESKIDYLYKKFNITWISGLIYFLLCLVEAVLYFSKFFEKGVFIDKYYIIIIELASLIALVFFMNGFILIGKTLNNSLLKVTAFFIIFITGIYYTFDFFSLFTIPVLDIFNIIFGVASAFLGISLLKIQKEIGPLAAVTGVFQIITALFFLTAVLNWIGLLFLLAAIVFEIIILYKLTEKLRVIHYDLQIRQGLNHYH